MAPATLAAGDGAEAGGSAGDWGGTTGSLAFRTVCASVFGTYEMVVASSRASRKGLPRWFRARPRTLSLGARRREMQVWGSGTGDSGEHALKGRWISAIVVSKVKPLLRTQLQSVSDNGVVSVSLHSHRDCRISPPQFDALFNTAPGARCLVFSLHVNCKSTPKSSATRKLTQSGGRCRSSRKTLDSYRGCPGRRGRVERDCLAGAVSIGSFELSRWRLRRTR